MIEQARFERRLVYHIDVPSTLRECFVPALLLQPLVENAVKHGIQSSQPRRSHQNFRRAENGKYQRPGYPIHRLLFTADRSRHGVRIGIDRIGSRMWNGRWVI